MYSNIIKKINKKNILFRLIIFCLTLFASAVIFNLLQVPINMTAGGASGLAIVLHKVIGIEQNLLVTIIYIITLVLSLIFLDFEKTISILLATLIYPFFVNLTVNITDFIKIDYSDVALVSIFCGFLNGCVYGICYRIGFNPGGLSVIAQIIYKYFKISVSKVNLIMSIIIVLAGGYYYGVNNILYAIIVMYITALMTDKVLLGISKNKYIYIVTKEEDKIEEFITKNLNHGVTKILCETGFMKHKKYVLMTSIPTREYMLFKEGIKFIDESAFLLATDAYETSGGI